MVNRRFPEGKRKNTPPFATSMDMRPNGKRGGSVVVRNVPNDVSATRTTAAAVRRRAAAANLAEKSQRKATGKKPANPFNPAMAQKKPIAGGVVPSGPNNVKKAAAPARNPNPDMTQEYDPNRPGYLKTAAATRKEWLARHPNFAKSRGKEREAFLKRHPGMNTHNNAFLHNREIRKVNALPPTTNADYIAGVKRRLAKKFGVK